MIVAISSIITALGGAVALVIQSIKLSKCTIADCIPIKKCESIQQNAIQQRVLPADETKSVTEVPREATCEKSLAQWRDFSPTHDYSDSA